MKRRNRFVIPMVISLVILFVIFWMDGLYPFGDRSVIQIDADYQFIPVLYRIYDMLCTGG